MGTDTSHVGADSRTRLGADPAPGGRRGMHLLTTALTDDQWTSVALALLVPLVPLTSGLSRHRRHLRVAAAADDPVGASALARGR